MTQVEIFQVDSAPEQVEVRLESQVIGHVAVAPEVNLDDTQEFPPISAD